MKIQYASVWLEREIPRLPGGSAGLASSSTTHFDFERHGVTIELDTASGMVRLSKGDVEQNVHVSKTERFGPMLKP